MDKRAVSPIAQQYIAGFQFWVDLFEQAVVVRAQGAVKTFSMSPLP